MLIRKKTNETELKNCRNLKPLTLFNLVECLGELKKQGYFYDREDVVSVSGPCLTIEKERELLCLSQEWNAEQIEEKGITAIWIVFCHVITREERYLFIQEEMFEDEVQTVMWMDDDYESACTGGGRVTYVKDMPIVFEEIMRRCEMILVPRKFYKLDFEQFSAKIGDSLFVLLYKNCYHQVQEGKIEIENEWKRSFAWAGEFYSEYWGREQMKYLEMVIYHRSFTEFCYGTDGEIINVWNEQMTDVYVAWSQEKLSEAGPEDEKKIPLKELKTEEEIADYLKKCHDLDHELICHNE